MFACRSGCKGALWRFGSSFGHASSAAAIMRLIPSIELVRGLRLGCWPANIQSPTTITSFCRAFLLMGCLLPVSRQLQRLLVPTKAGCALPAWACSAPFSAGTSAGQASWLLWHAEAANCLIRKVDYATAQQPSSWGASWAGSVGHCCRPLRRQAGSSYGRHPWYHKP